MERQPLMSHPNPTYGVANPGYVPAAAGAPAMFAPPAADSQGPSAPPASMFDSVPGYEGTVAGGGGFLPPPMPAFPAPQPQPGPQQPNWNIPSITEETAKEAFILYASSKCCYSSGPAKDGVITGMDAFNTYRYRLETFTESRSTEWSHEPYHGQPVDAFAQPPPGPWDIPAKTPTFFVDDKQMIKVPYTSSVKSCHGCTGMGRKPCKDCAGAGNFVGSATDLVSATEMIDAITAVAEEEKTATTVMVKDRSSVTRVMGNSSFWSTSKTNHSDNYVVEQSSGLQLDNLSKVSGKELFKDSQYMVYPLMGFPDVAVVSAAQRLVSEHQGKFSQTSRILQQRQTIELIPVTKVTYSWKGKSHIYFVYGNEFKVNAENYPATCCCSIM